MATLDSLLVVKTSTIYKAEILADLADPAIVGGSGLPTTSWQAGAVARTLIAGQAEISADLHTSLRAIAGSGFLSTAADADDDWLTLLADELYDVQRDAPVATIGIATLTDAGGGPHVIAAGVLIASDGVSGHQYRNLTGGTLALSGTLHLRWQAVGTGSLYNVGVGSITTLVTALAGVSISNPATWITLPGTVAGFAQGTIRITDGAMTGPHTVGAGTVTVNDGVHSYTNVNAFTITTAGGYADVLFQATVVGLAWNVANNTITTVAVTPVAGLTSNNPATTWITTSGSDEQSNTSLEEECRDKWSTLGVGWNASAVEYLAKQAPIDSGTAITRVRVITNPGGVAGTVSVVIGSTVGAVAPADVQDVQDYFDDDRTTLCSVLTVSSCASVAIALTGTVRVPAAYSAAAQTSATNNLTMLASNTPVGGDDDLGNTLVWEAITSAIKNEQFNSSGTQINAGAALDIDITAVTVGGVPGTVGADIALTSSQVPTFTISGLTWTSV